MASSTKEVLERLEAIDSALPATDGVKWFNKLYLEMTQGVFETLPGLPQAAPGFLEALDVAFGNLYFDALDAAGSGSSPPAAYPFHAWKPLFEARFDTEIAPIQFALAGMNAHINHDLAIGISDVFAARGTDPGDDTPERRDYESVNELIAAAEEKTKLWMVTGLLKELDVAFHSTDDIVAVWNIARARDAAWVSAEVISSLDLPPLRKSYEEVNDRTVGFAGRALLNPVGLLDAQR
ncbi:MAG TPA: DUF5995 family protein [Solirubrobacterales bacterium]|nr:DUF5995 family protein [Solirubrobacterales bacterium]